MKATQHWALTTVLRPLTVPTALCVWTYLSCCCSSTAILLCLYCRVRLLTWVGCAVSTISTHCKGRHSAAQHSTRDHVCDGTPETPSLQVGEGEHLHNHTTTISCQGEDSSRSWSWCCNRQTEPATLLQAGRCPLPPC